MRSILIILSILVSFTSFQAAAQSNGHVVQDSTGGKQAGYDLFKSLNNMIDSVSVTGKDALVKQFENVEIKGWIFFTGTNFLNAVSTLYSGNGISGLQHWLDKCVAGSRLTFEKCQIKKPDGTYFVLNKHIVFK